MIAMKCFKMQKYYLKIFTVISLWIIVSCVNQGGSKKTATSNDSIKTSIKDNSYLESVYYRFPTPNEIFGFINNEKLKISKNENYNTRTLSLFYWADLFFTRS